jgi:hypothetical protein
MSRYFLVLVDQREPLAGTYGLEMRYFLLVDPDLEDAIAISGSIQYGLIGLVPKASAVHKCGNRQVIPGLEGWGLAYEEICPETGQTLRESQDQDNFVELGRGTWE